MGKFKTKARAIELLGKKQIRDSVTALSELMKNSYDADAEKLRVEFNTKGESVPYIAIYDTGIGMDSFDVDNKWLVLGTESKKVTKQTTTPKGRILMGEKGIGRLAVSKLGQQTIMLTKKNTKWNIVYLNWNLFENPYFMIEEIVIPVKFEVEANELPDILNELVQEQKTNLYSKNWDIVEIAKENGEPEKNIEELLLIPELKTIWDLRQQIARQVENLEVPTDDILDMCDFIESEGNHGTILLSFDLNDDWDKYLNLKNRDSNQKSIDEKNYDRLAAFISDFQHTDPNFSVEVFSNGEIQLYNYDYTEEDYEKYDLKIEGKICNGCFYGCINARNADKKLLEDCNQELGNGLNVTRGFADWKKSDCGEFTVKFCHVELMERNTGLSKDEFEEIKKKMSMSGGIAVYRDNMRILPYGEVGNDFLELERQRTGRAGDFIFSHRNVFGRIDISSKNNPLLEDKSSREGFIENVQYFYFLSTLQNLLIRLSKEILNGGTKSKNLRDTYVGYNNLRMEELKQKEAAEREEEKREKEYIRQVKAQLKDNTKVSKSSFKKIHAISESMLKTWFDKADSYAYWNSEKEKLKKNVMDVKRQISAYKKLQIQINERYRYILDEKDIEAIGEFNQKMEEDAQYLTNYYKEIEQRQKKAIEEGLASWIETASGELASSPLEYIDFLRRQVNDLNHTLRENEEQVKSESKEREEQLIHKFDTVLNMQSDIQQYRKKYLKQISQENQKINREVDMLLKQCDELTQAQAKDVTVKEKDIVKATSEIEKKILALVDQEQNQMQNEYDEFDKQVDMMMFYLQDGNMQETQQLLGLLKERNIQLQDQVDMYAELANTGLAADIVNHEFNQLFTNVYDAIKQMRFQQMSSDAKYYLKEIEIGFRAISSRQSQLSPMYRSRSTKRINLNVRNMIDDLKKFFHDKLKDSDIVLRNEVSSDQTIFISESGIYPVLSNLIYNSLYWLADQDEKEILFHFEEDENALYVEDSGCGIETRNLEKIFEPFFSLKRIPRGLGLTISRKVLERQGNSIKAVNTGDKKMLSGACFVISFNVDKV